MAVKQVPINDELNDFYELEAKRNKRSKTMEIEYVLEKHMLEQQSKGSWESSEPVPVL